MKLKRDELRAAMKAHFGHFGEACFSLAELRSHTEKVSDREIEASFSTLAGRHRKLFNKKAFIASCREPD
jgi:hypothetical protein